MASEVRQPPERRLSRKAGIVQWCLKRFAFCPPVFPAGFRFSLQKGDSLQIVHTQTQIYSYLPRIIKASKEQKPFDPLFSISNKISYFLYSFLFSNSKMQKLLRSTAGRGSFCFLQRFFARFSPLIFRARSCKKAFLPHNVCLFANKITIRARITGNIARRGV